MVELNIELNKLIRVELKEPLSSRLNLLFTVVNACDKTFTHVTNDIMV